MKKVDINNTTDENIAAAHGLTVEYVKRVKEIRKGVQVGDVKLAAIATGFEYSYVHKVLCFSRKNPLILKTLQKIQRNRAKLLAESPRFEGKKVIHPLTEQE